MSKRLPQSPPPSRALHVAVPALDELDSLPQCLAALAAQDHERFVVWVCLNQPERWWSDSPS